jgi:hypothetical protein
MTKSTKTLTFTATSKGYRGNMEPLDSVHMRKLIYSLHFGVVMLDCVFLHTFTLV